MLPQEIIIDILTRLPVKSIGRFRCVSKPWLSFLTQPKFIKDHLTQYKQCPVAESLMLVSIDSNLLYSVPLSNAHSLFDEITLSAFNLNFAVHPDFWTEGIPSCDGLVLIGGINDERLLINPITREVRKLPISPYGLDPCASFTMYGLGYDSVSDDYKVVTLSYYDSANEHEPDCTEMFVNVYSVRHGAWKKVESSPYDHAVGHVTSGVFVSGCVHWLASRTTDYSSVIVGFDLAEEKFREVPPPSSVDRARFVFDRLVVLGRCLCLFPSTSGIETDIWVMMNYGVQESWSKFTITDAEEAEFRPVCISGQEVVMVKNEETLSETLVLYHLEKETIKDIKVHGISEEFHVGGTYMETLVSPYHNSEPGEG